MKADVLAAGCVFPSGPGLGLADVALRTGLSLVRRHPFFVDRSGQGVRVSCFTHASLTFDQTRWAALANAALADLRSNMAHLSTDWLVQQSWQMWVVLPGADRATGAEALYDAIAPVLALWPYPPQTVEVRLGGHAAGVAAIGAAAVACAESRHCLALVLALDSQMDAVALSALERRRLLHGAGEQYDGAVRINPYGRIPGEGAAALLLTAPGLRGPQEQAWCRLAAVASGHEAHLAWHDEPCTGQGLTSTARCAIDAANLISSQRLDSLTHDATGEPYRADEFGFTALRIASDLAPEYQRITPSLASADLGAASAVAHAALVAWRCRDADANDGETAGACGLHLILASSDDSERGAMVLQAFPRSSVLAAA